MTIDKINSYIFTPTMKLKREYLVPQEVKDFLFKKYSFCKCYNEVIYCLKNNIDECPVCPVCGKQLKFLLSKNRYQHHCSQSCAQKDPIIKDKHIKSNLEKFGCESIFSKNSPIRKKIEDKFIEKYGAKNMMKTSLFREKSKQTKLEKYGNPNYSGDRNKANEVAIERYGTARNYKKITETMLEKYGQKSFLSTDYINKIRNNKSIQEKIQKTKKLNHTFNTSKAEEFSYKLLLSKFDKKDILRQYKSKEYPYNSDFYIKSKKLYIECNYHWTHGNHLFNSNNENDIKILNEWKSKNTKYYKNAINTWTVRDIKKYNISKINNLNIKFFYSLEEFENFIKCVSTIPDECKEVELEISTSSERKASKEEHIVSAISNN